MGLNLSRFYTIPFAGQGSLTEVDFNKPSKQPPLAVRVSIDWSLQDSRYAAVRPLTTEPYAVSIDVARALVRAIDDIKSCIIDNTSNPYPVLLECEDSGFQIRVEAGEFRQSLLLTTQTTFKLWSLFGVGQLNSGKERYTDIYFTNITTQSFSAKSPGQNISFSPTIPLLTGSNKIALAYQSPLSGSLKSLTVDTDVINNASNRYIRFTINIETPAPANVYTLYDGRFYFLAGDTLRLAIYDELDINLPFARGNYLYLQIYDEAGSSYIQPRAHGVIAI